MIRSISSIRYTVKSIPWMATQAIHSTRIVGQTINQNDTKLWLLRDKNLSESVALKVMKAFPQTPTISEIQLLGDAGLNALVKAVLDEEQRNQAKALKPKVVVHIEVPKERHSFTVEANEGDTIYDMRQYSPELQGVIECACQGIAACSTCHIYVPSKEDRAKLPPLEENELDMLDLAWGVKKSSRLGCQIKFTKELNNIRIVIPNESNNLFN